MVTSVPKTRFIPTDKDRNQFFTTLKARVDDYFESNGLSRHANSAMIIKTLAMFAIFFVPYILVITGTVGFPLSVLMYFIMGIGTAGIGFSVMHDSVHGSYSSSPFINRLMGMSMSVIGGSAFTWKIQHNLLHHTYTNITGLDEDIAYRHLLRFSPNDPLKKIHRFQYLYAFPLYGLMTFGWVLLQDYTQMIRYYRAGLVEKVKGNYVKEWLSLLFFKNLYIFYIVILPMLVTDLLWWQVLLGLVAMHYVAGLMMAGVFQLAHVVEEAHFPLPNQDNIVENAWAIHQIETTMDFAPKNSLVTWFVGGLNFQVEHHLFPNICHVHYPALAKITQQTAEEFGIRYNYQKTLTGAIRSHINMLYALGNPQMA
jgi:linoleoyl-CoA desaturase